MSEEIQNHSVEVKKDDAAHSGCLLNSPEAIQIENRNSTQREENPTVHEKEEVQRVPKDNETITKDVVFEQNYNAEKEITVIKDEISNREKEENIPQNVQQQSIHEQQIIHQQNELQVVKIEQSLKEQASNSHQKNAIESMPNLKEINEQNPHIQKQALEAHQEEKLHQQNVEQSKIENKSQKGELSKQIQEARISNVQLEQVEQVEQLPIAKQHEAIVQQKQGEKMQLEHVQPIVSTKENVKEIVIDNEVEPSKETNVQVQLEETILPQQKSVIQQFQKPIEVVGVKSETANVVTGTKVEEVDNAMIESNPLKTKAEQSQIHPINQLEDPKALNDQDENIVYEINQALEVQNMDAKEAFSAPLEGKVQVQQIKNQLQPSEPKQLKSILNCEVAPESQVVEKEQIIAEQKKQLTEVKQNTEEVVKLQFEQSKQELISHIPNQEIELLKQRVEEKLNAAQQIEEKVEQKKSQAAAVFDQNQEQIEEQSKVQERQLAPKRSQQSPHNAKAEQIELLNAKQQQQRQISPQEVQPEVEQKNEPKPKQIQSQEKQVKVEQIKDPSIKLEDCDFHQQQIVGKQKSSKTNLQELKAVQTVQLEDKEAQSSKMKEHQSKIMKNEEISKQQFQQSNPLETKVQQIHKEIMQQRQEDVTPAQKINISIQAKKFFNQNQQVNETKLKPEVEGNIEDASEKLHYQQQKVSQIKQIDEMSHSEVKVAEQYKVQVSWTHSQIEQEDKSQHSQTKQVGQNIQTKPNFEEPTKKNHSQPIIILEGYIQIIDQNEEKLHVPIVEAQNPSQQLQKDSAIPQETVVQSVELAQKGDHLESNVKQVSEVEKKAEPQQNIGNDFSEQFANKQKYRFNTQLVDSVSEEKPKNQQLIEFIEFSQPEKTEPNQQHLQKGPEKEKIQFPLAQVGKNSNELNITFSPEKQPSKEHEKPYKTINILNEQMQSKNTGFSKQGVGRISKKHLNERRVHDVIADLQKYNEQKPIALKIQKERRPSSRKRKTDSSRLEHIALRSNIFNLTIGQLLSNNESEEAEKMLVQIDGLKKKLFQLEKKRELTINTNEQPQKGESQMFQNWQQEQKDTTSKTNKKLLTGRIYRRAESNNSRITEQIQTQGYLTEKQPTGFKNSATISSAPRQRLSSTQDFPGDRTAFKQPGLQNKTGPIIFRVKKNNKTLHGAFDFNLAEKSEKESFARSKQFESSDKCFQARRQELDKLEFTSQENFHIVEKPAPRKLIFQENFKEQTDRFFIQLGNQLPKKDWTQEQLVETAKQTFKKFGANIHAEKHLTLGVKKYKNCVSFILDSSRTILWYYEGKFYYGGWKTNNSGEGEKSGWGYDYSPGKYVYSGSFIDNKRDGYGVIAFLTKENDLIYQGQWKNGFKHGRGKQREADGSEYIGEWVQGKKNGFGKLRISQKQSYEGNFLSGIKNGEGNEKFKNGDSYEGNYYDGKFHGMGVYVWANLSRYEGQFKEGARNGNGIWFSNYIDENSDRYEGQYKNDRKNGFGVYKWKDGTIYEGQFVNDLKHGEGIVSYGDGRSTKLQWFEGNVIPKQSAEKPRTGIKRSISKSSSKKTEQKNSQSKPPLIKFNPSNESKLKPTRISLGIEQM